MVKVFKEEGTFSSLYAAQKWLDENGYSYGSLCRDMPVGIMKGDYSISKWKNLTSIEKRSLHGTIQSEDFREGAVIVDILPEFS